MSGCAKYSLNGIIELKMLILLTGASGAGKSTYARRLAMSLCRDLTFISTEIPDPGIKANPGQLRSAGFSFIERFMDVGGLDARGGAAILDCLCNLTANEMFDENGGIRENVVDTVTEGVLRLAGRFGFLIVITNEIASDGVSYEESVSAYRDALCAVNRELAMRADCVFELCVSIPVAVKGSLVQINEENPG